MLEIEQFKKLQELKELVVSKLKILEKLNISYFKFSNKSRGGIWEK